MEKQIQLQEQKKQAWGNYGAKLVTVEADLQVKKMVVLKTLIEPTKENVKNSEEILKSAKYSLKDIFAERKKMTDPIDAVKSRLMDVEKSVEAEIKVYETKIISVKKEIEAIEKEKNAESEERKDFLAKLNQAYIELEDEIQKFVSEITNIVYLFLLNNDVPYDDYDHTIKDKLSDKDTVKTPTIKEVFAKQNYKNVKLTQLQTSELFLQNQKEVTNPFDAILDNLAKKKIGYKSELANKEMAKELLLKQQKEADKKRLEEKQHAELSAKIEQATTEQLQPKSDVKELKKTYQVEMPDTHQTALQLFATFSSNLDLVLPRLKVNKWFAFTPLQIANVLGRLKTENNSLQFSGIEFKEVDKL